MSRSRPLLKGLKSWEPWRARETLSGLKHLFYGFEPRVVAGAPTLGHSTQIWSNPPKVVDA